MAETTYRWEMKRNIEKQRRNKAGGQRSSKWSRTFKQQRKASTRDPSRFGTVGDDSVCE